MFLLKDFGTQVPNNQLNRAEISWKFGLFTQKAEIDHDLTSLDTVVIFSLTFIRSFRKLVYRDRLTPAILFSS